ncbi:uncharacterized protein LOC122757305 [Drosophila mojavensis]|uniref:uncharacterized protein LOC122757305 n=1 Tax=Drosophila mojavensis TaxID=7230 RepID=UPI00017C8B3F|nr:uncharacterized protein LOC122757305 [Drosophila mojavensis]
MQSGTLKNPNGKLPSSKLEVNSGAMRQKQGEFVNELRKNSEQTIKYTYEEKRKASSILKHQRTSNITNPSAAWLKKLEWANTVFPNFGQQVQRTKRQHSQDVSGPSVKHAKLPPTKSLFEMTKDSILIGVFDRGHAEGRIPRRYWKWIEAALADKCFDLLVESESGPPPSCKDVGWYQGNVKIISCDSQRSVELYKKAVANVGEVYPGAQLVAVDWSEVPSRPRARVWIPATIKEPERILKMLQLCNPQLPTHDWKVVKVEANEGAANQVVLVLNKESLAPLEASNGELNFGFSSVVVKVYKSDVTPGKMTNEQHIETSEAELDGYMSDTSTLTRGLQALSYDDHDDDDDDDNDDSHLVWD